MKLAEWLGRLLGYENVSSIESVRTSFGASWAHNGPAWVVFGCLGLAALSAYFYLRLQPRRRKATHIGLAVVRGLLLCLLFLILTDPILELKFVSHPRPFLWVLLDGTDSMGIVDELPSDERAQLADAVGLENYLTRHPSVNPQSLRRSDYVRALFQQPRNNLLEQLAEKFRLRAYVFDSAEGVRAVQVGPATEQDELDPRQLAEDYTTDGTVTALGNAFEDLARRHAAGNLAGALVVSDFDYNAGTPPLNAATKLGVPIFTLGIGPRTAADVSVDLMAPLTMKKAEASTVNVTVRQRELDGLTTTVRVTARKASESDKSAAPIVVGEKSVTLTGGSIPVEFPFTPEDTGRFTFAAEVAPVEGETEDQTRNNRAERIVQIIDDFLRLMYVEYEPTWEWRFIKEVFHRDKLVGLRGFRTYLRSADPVVRETNELFLPSLTLPRSEFFAQDVIFLGDMPASALSTRFCEMTKEFVSQFGGGLVVLAGPRFGPGELAHTPLADMLPVVVDPDARIRDDHEVRLTLTPYAAQYDFMRLGRNDFENTKAWTNLGKLPWYQPVKRVEPRASTVLAVTEGKNPEPLIVLRKYGRGEVVFVAFDEMWRLRRLHGERYYRQFWGQLIHRLGLSHALGDQKRFVMQTDKQQYRAEDTVLLTVEAYDRDFHPLSEEDVPEKKLHGELLRPQRGDGASHAQPLTVTQVKPGVFETEIPVYEGGEYHVRVTDPLTNEASEIQFDVTSVSAERRSVVRNVSLQENIAAATNGKSYELTNIAELPNDFDPPRLTETTLEIFPLWSTWVCFGAVVLLMLGEWAIRKLVNLS